jgi:RHS repeat-associated protein
VEKVNQYEAGAAAAYITTTATYEAPIDAYSIYHIRKLSDEKLEIEGGQLTTRVEYSSFDECDNPGQIQTFGDNSITVDNKKVVTTYINVTNDATKWLIGFPKQSTTSANTAAEGDDAAWITTSDKKITYDSQPFGSIVKGKITQEDSWLDQNTSGGPLVSTFPSTWTTTGTTTYNDAGADKSGTINIVNQPFAGKGVTTLETTFNSYDSTKRFATKTTKNWHDGQTWESTASYDIWGHTIQMTDIHGITSDMSYDALGRPLTVCVTPPNMASFRAKTYNYDHAFDGSGSQYVTLKTSAPISNTLCTADGALTVQTWYDGLGRETKTQSPGWNGQVVTLTIYEPNQGRLLGTSRPQFSGSVPTIPSNPTAIRGNSNWIAYSYDNRGRVSNAYGYTKTKSYSYGITSAEHWRYASVTLSGHTKTTYTDAFDRVREVANDTAATLYYYYSVMGSISHVSYSAVDASGASALVKLTSDSWGRKLSYWDKDSGVTSRYYYDLAGRLTWQEDCAADNAGKHTTVMTYNEYQGKLSAKEVDANLKTIYSYYPSSQKSNSGEIATITDTFKGVYDSAKTATRSYSRTWSTDPAAGAVLNTEVGYQLPWKETPSGGSSLSLAFSTITDWQGNIVQSIMPGGETTKQTYQSTSGLPVSVTDGATPPAAYAQFTDYGPVHLNQWKRGSASQIITTYTREFSTDHLTRVLTTGAGSAIVQDTSYDFFPDDLVKQCLDNTVTNYDQYFTYDSQMHLKCLDMPSPGQGKKRYLYTASQGSPIADNLIGNDDRTLTYGKTDRPHQVTADSLHWSYTYDYYGRLWHTERADQYYDYVYNDWSHLKEIKKNSSRTAYYEYFGEGERFKKVVYDGAQPYEHITLPEYEIEQLKSGCVRVRWAVTGPTGVIAWKQSIQAEPAFAQNVNRRGEYLLASMGWERFWSGITGSGYSFQSSRSLKDNLVGAFTGTCQQTLETYSALFSMVRHGMSGFSNDPEGQRLLGLWLLALALLLSTLLLWSSRFRARVGRVVLWRAYQPSPIDPVPAFGIWSAPTLRAGARLIVLALLFQGGTLLIPMPTQAACTTPCSETYYPLSDALGTVTTLLDQNGRKVYEQHFLPFGQKDDATCSAKPDGCGAAGNQPCCTNGEATDPWSYGFTGQFQDEESGLIYMHARYYNPAISHFMTPDSVVGSPGDSLSFDRYSYVRNNPVNFSDPTGHFWAALFLSMAIGAVAGGIAAAVAGQNVLTGMLRGALYGGAGYAVTAGLGSTAMGQAVVRRFGAGALGAMTATVGGLTSVTMGGSFSQGFTIGAMSAGVAIGAEEIATSIVFNQTSYSSTEEVPAPAPASEEMTVKYDQALTDILKGVGANRTYLAGFDATIILPDASSLPVNYRTLTIIHNKDYNLDEPGVQQIVSAFTEAGKAKGYRINDIYVDNRAQLKSALKNLSPTGALVFAIHGDVLGIYFAGDPAFKRTSPQDTAKYFSRIPPGTVKGPTYVWACQAAVVGKAGQVYGLHLVTPLGDFAYGFPKPHGTGGTAQW